MTDHWIGLELRHLSALQAVANEGSFTEAARRLGYTPSAVSQQIASLERVIGTSVIARHGRKTLGLTEAGRLLLCHLSVIEARLSAARVEIEAVAQGVLGPLRVAAYESVAKHMLPEIIVRFRPAFPDIRIDVVDAHPDQEILRAVERGLVDLAFTSLPLPSGPFHSKTIMSEPWVLVAPAHSRYTGSPPTTLEEVAAMPIISYRSARMLERLASRFRAVGIELNIVLRSDYDEVIHELVAADLGVAIVPRLAARRDDERFAIHELGMLIPERDVTVVWRSDHDASEACRAVISLAEELGASLEGSRVSGTSSSRSLSHALRDRSSLDQSGRKAREAELARRTPPRLLMGSREAVESVRASSAEGTEPRL